VVRATPFTSLPPTSAPPANEASPTRTLENTGDPAMARELARHKDLRTTQGHLHARRARVWSAAARLNRK
jgi:hypothetical protein